MARREIQNMVRKIPGRSQKKTNQGKEGKRKKICKELSISGHTTPVGHQGWE